MQVRGKWHSQGSAAYQPAVLTVTNQDYRLEIDDGESYSGNLNRILVSDRIGNVERKLTLEDGSSFATLDNDAIDRLFKGHGRLSGFIHTFESHFGLAVIALVLTVSFAFSFFRWGVPWISNAIAHALPQQTNNLIASETLDFLDRFYFQESELDATIKTEIRARFEEKLIPLDQANQTIRYKLHFREWKLGEDRIANALALPSGDIILTDAFVELSHNQDEIDAVLLHEMGHIVHRHSLQTVISSTLVTTIVVILTGDSGSLVDLSTGLGSLLASSGYSRNHESEADRYAFEQMLKAKIDPDAFSQIMRRLSAEFDSSKEAKNSSDTLQDETEEDYTGYFSSHPSTRERIEQANKYHQCFLDGLTICDAPNGDL